MRFLVFAVTCNLFLLKWPYLSQLLALLRLREEHFYKHRSNSRARYISTFIKDEIKHVNTTFEGQLLSRSDNRSL